MPSTEGSLPMMAPLRRTWSKFFLVIRGKGERRYEEKERTNNQRKKKQERRVKQELRGCLLYEESLNVNR
jgi:hypothetical protein